MEILIFKKQKYDDSFRYYPIYSDNSTINILGTFLSDTSFITNDILERLKNNKFNNYIPDFSFEFEYIKAFSVNETINIYFDFENEIFGYPLPENTDKFTIKKEKFINLLGYWKEVHIKQPTYVILKISENDISFEEDYREEITLNLSEKKLTDESIRNIFNLKIRNDLFYGGLHLEDESMQLNKKTKNSKKVISADFEIKNDYTFNHTMFSNEYNQQEIIDKLNDKKIGTMSSIKYLKNKEENIFCGWTTLHIDSSKIATALRIIYNKNMEIITAYPIFEENK